MVDGTPSQIPALSLLTKFIQTFAQYPQYHVTYEPAKFEVATSNCLGDAFARKYIFWQLTFTLVLSSRLIFLYIMWAMHL